MEPVHSSNQWSMTPGIPPMYGRRLAQLQMQTFCGDISQFPVFLRRFKNFIEVHCSDDKGGCLTLKCI